MNKLISFIILSSCFFFSFCLQGKGKIPSYIANDTTIKRGFYRIDQNVSIAKNATVTIDPGAQIELNKGAAVLVYGGVIIRGTNDLPVKVISKDVGNLGTGFKIIGKSNKRIVIENTVFDNIKIPLNFHGFWQRSNVRIEKNIFKNISTGEPGIIINNAYPSADKVIGFEFRQNKFIDNYSSIFVSFYTSNNVDLVIENNVISRNFIFGYNTDGAKLANAAPIHFQVNSDEMKYPVKFRSNSIFDNYVISIGQIYVKLTELNIGFTGNAPGIVLDENYYGPEREYEDVQSAIAAENSSVVIQGVLPKPSKETPNHLVTLTFHGRKVYDGKNEFVPWETRNFVDSFNFEFSMPVKNAVIEEVLYSDSWKILVSSALTDSGINDNQLDYDNGGKTLNAVCPFSKVDEDQKNIIRFYSLKFSNKDGSKEEINIGKIYMDIFLFEKLKKFSFELKHFTIEEYEQFYSFYADPSKEIIEESPYQQELMKMERMIEASSDLNIYILGDELKAFKKKWKKTPSYSHDDYKRLKRMMSSKSL